MKTFYLDFHVDYACQNSGACCSAGWPVPLEHVRLDPARQAIGDRRIVLTNESWLDAAGVLSHTHDGSCVFHQDHSCAIHRALGPAAKPIACQHFPRICLIDRRGVFVTLSHYCPTAASMLFVDRTANIVEGPPLFPNDEIPEGLDARDQLPPLLTSQVLMDYEGYDAWEHHMIWTLTAAPSPESALATLRVHARELEKWRPGGQELRDAVQSLTPVDDAVASHWSSFAPVVGRYLASHAFGSWVAYQGNGVGAIVRSLEVALETLRVETTRQCSIDQCELGVPQLREAIRRADLLLRHAAP